MIVGAWCGLPYLTRTDPVTDLCQRLSSEFGQAQAYFHSEQNDGEAWLIAEGGAVTGRWIAEYPDAVLAGWLQRRTGARLDRIATALGNGGGLEVLLEGC